MVRPSDSDPIVCVVRITGESDFFLYEPSKTIVALKDEIKHELDIGPEKQELIYKGRELCVSYNKIIYFSQISEIRQSYVHTSPNVDVFLSFEKL